MLLCQRYVEHRLGNLGKLITYLSSLSMTNSISGARMITELWGDFFGKEDERTEGHILFERNAAGR